MRAGLSSGNFFFDRGKLIAEVEKSFRDTFKECGCIFINQLGGCLPSRDGMTITNEIVKSVEDIIFPEFIEKDIRITKWEGGTHYYVYVGPYNIVYKGTRKWNTEKEAKEIGNLALDRILGKAYSIKSNELKIDFSHRDFENEITTKS